MVTCMKVTGETFSFFLKEKEPKRQDTKCIQTFRQKDCYRTELWRALYKKAPTGQFLIFRNNLTEFIKKLSPNFLGRIFQVKGQSKKIYLLCPFYFLTCLYFIIRIVEYCASIQEFVLS